MFTYKPKSMSLATDFRIAGPVLAGWGYIVKIKRGILTTNAEPRAVSMAIQRAIFLKSL